MTSNGQTGFIIPYTVQDTPDKGKGVFADAPISKGTILWRHVRGQYAVFDERSLKEFVAQLSRSEVVYELEHMFGLPEFPGYVIRILDDGVLINHSHHPNVAMNAGAGDYAVSHNASSNEVEHALLNDRFALIATQDLQIGDELTMDYNIGIEDPPFYDALTEQYEISSPWM